MSVAQFYYQDQSFWTDKSRYDEAEAKYQEFLANKVSAVSQVTQVLIGDWQLMYI